MQWKIKLCQKLKAEKKLISIVTPTYNEEENIQEYNEIKKSISDISEYEFEILVIDNDSTDKTQDILIAGKDSSLKVIINNRNFGHIRNHLIPCIYNPLGMQRCILLRLQDPPKYIPELIEKWKSGFKIVLAVKPESESGFLFRQIRKILYRLFNKISDVPIIKDLNWLWNL